MALRLHNRRLFPLFFFGTSVAVVVLWYLFAVGHRVEVLLSAIGILVSFAYFLYRQHLDETKLFIDLFVEFNGRYDKINEGLNSIRLGPKECELSKDERDLLFSYFNLCAEEYFFYKAGYLDQSVWQAWCRGMNDFFDHPRIRDLWDLDCRSDSYYGFRPGAFLLESHSWRDQKLV